MTTNTTPNELTDRLLAWNFGLGWVNANAPLMGAAIIELAAGEPVELQRVAARAGLTEPEVRDFFRQTPAEWDDHGRLVGFGVTLRETRHRYTTGGRTLYTWCAPDALAFPALTDQLALIESTCHETGVAIRVDITPDGVRNVDPAGAVVSIVPRDIGVQELRELLCNEQHFFATVDAAEAWRGDRDDVILVPVADAFEPLRTLMRHWTPTPREVA